MKKLSSSSVKKIRMLSVINAIVIVLVVLVYYAPTRFSLFGWRDFLHYIERVSLNFRYDVFAVRGGALVAGGVAQQQVAREGFYRTIQLISVDEDSIKHFQSFPMPVSVWVSVLEHFLAQDAARRPATLFFNLSLYDKPYAPLEEILQDYPIPLGMDFRLERRGEYADYASEEAQAMRRFEIHLPGDIELSEYNDVTVPPVEFMRRSGFMGYLNLEGVEDVKYKVPLFATVRYRYGDGFTNVVYPSAALMIALHYTGIDATNIRVESGRVILPGARLQDSVMDIVIPVDDRLRMRVHYKSAGHYLNTIPLKDLFRAGLPRQSILIFGVRALGTAADNFPSPLGSMFSADHIAYALGTILNRDFLMDVPRWAEIVGIIGWLVLLQVLLIKGLKTTILALVVAVFVPIGLGLALFRMGLVVATFLPLIAGVIFLILGEIYVLMTEGREKRLIKATFSRYVSPDLVNILVDDPSRVELGGMEREVTMLFSDIRGFTSLSEGMKPTDLIAFLNIYLSQMTDIVLETKGSLDKYIGDAVVAFWGAPLPVEDHAYQACAAAVKMVEKLKEFNANLVREGKQPITIGIGLNTGTITVGNIGSVKKKNYTAVGEPIVLTEELQDENKTYKTTVIISEFTYQKVKERVIVRELDFYPYEGGRIRIYELLGIV